ncbi:MAG: Light-sensor Protein kinase [Icmadophila ericetorum]|nr:Light-sensor Protein kinase [Icmadophila ericetorum]
MWSGLSNPNEDNSAPGEQSRSLQSRSGSDQSPSPHSPRPELWESHAGPDSHKTPVRHTRCSQTPPSTNTTTTDSPFGPLNPGISDRVFPIRSVISVDPTQTPYLQPEVGRDGFPGFSAPTESTSSSRRPSNPRGYPPSNSSTTQTSAVAQTDTPLRIRHNTQDRPKAQFSSVELVASGEGRRRSTSVAALPDKNGTQQIAKQLEDARSESTGGSMSGGRPSNSGSASIASSATEEPLGLTTARFKHVLTDSGHAVITGRDGDTLQRCEDEPIHIPGAVQGFGLLIALREEAESKLVVRVVSENSQQIIGYTPRHLFELENFCDIFSDEQADNLLDHLDFIRDDQADPATNGPEVFTISIRSPKRKNQKLWCAIHINDRNPGLVICEFELEDDHINPLVPAGDPTPEPPEDTLQSNPTAEEYAESTVNSSRPLRVLRSARKKKGEAAAMEVFNIMSQVQEQLANAATLEKFLKVLVGVIKELTGFHRVMIYQFDQSFNGKVVTELVDPRATKDLYKGLHFPASDIPKQARDLYKINKVRLLYDRDQLAARLVCRTMEDLETPLDLTYAYLRAMSPVHTKYLANMAVRASMSISINAFDELWGLIACHAYGSKGMRVSFPIRKMCRLVGDSASRNIERLSYASRLHARKLINTVPTEKNPSGYIIASSDDLLKLFDADYGILSIREETKILGKLDETQEGLALLEYLRLRRITSVVTSQDIRVDFPDLRYPPGFSVIAGLLLVPLSVSGQDFIVFFRKGQLREVKWAGNPYEKYVKEGTEGYLEPRKSFKIWTETVAGKCREWLEEEIETAAVLCLVYGKFIEVWRQKEAALQNSELTKLLLANSAHEVRTPLNAIINYLEIAMEGTLDQETRDNLSKSHSASKSLIYVINDLLDLTKTEEGHDLIKDDVFDLPATVREATDMFKGDAKRKEIDYDVVENPSVPKLVIGDQRRIRQAISNVTANAIQHTTHGAVKVELWLTESEEGRAEIEIVVQDTGVGMSSQKLDALFRELEQVQSENEESLQEKLTPNVKSIMTDKRAEKRTLGLGLAFVARIVRNMNGQLRLKSEEGKGSRFVIQLSFELPVNAGEQGTIEASKSSGVGPPDQPSTPPVAEGEVTLVTKSTPKRASGLGKFKEVTRRNSAESMKSIKSIKSMKSFKSGSSAKSEVDRLIDAIQEPTGVGMPNSETPTRSASRSSRNPSITSPRPKFARATTGEGLSEAGGEFSEVSRYPQVVDIPGQAYVMDQKTPIKPIRMADETSSTNPLTLESRARNPSRVNFGETSTKPTKAPTADHLQVLVAEDDPINSKIIKKRLEKAGHEVYLTINGEECASAYGEKSAFFDVVLMDMQMPIVDGLTSTKMIRSYEKSHSMECLSNRASFYGRVPIFAVSASLIEKDRQVYIDGGFDGWILKPIDFKRLSVLLTGIVEESTRKDCLYQQGAWEQGGWFAISQPDLFPSSTQPPSRAPVSNSTIASQPDHGDDPFNDPVSNE